MTQEKQGEADVIEPCPYCPHGGDMRRSFSLSRWDDRYWYFIECAECGARGPEETNYIDARMEWNRNSIRARRSPGQAEGGADEGA